jgi:hypothetical protein
VKVVKSLRIFKEPVDGLGFLIPAEGQAVVTEFLPYYILVVLLFATSMPSGAGVNVRYMTEHRLRVPLALSHEESEPNHLHEAGECLFNPATLATRTSSRGSFICMINSNRQYFH